MSVEGMEIDGDGWRSYYGGKRYRLLDDGCIEVECDGVARTRGNPLTARTNYHDYKAD